MTRAQSVPPELLAMKVEVDRRMRVATEEILRGADSNGEEIARKLIAKRREIELAAIDDLCFEISPRPTGAPSFVTRVAVAIAVFFFGTLAIAFLLPSVETSPRDRWIGAFFLLGIDAALVLVFFILPRMTPGNRYLKDLMRRETERRYANQA